MDRFPVAERSPAADCAEHQSLIGIADYAEPRFSVLQESDRRDAGPDTGHEICGSVNGVDHEGITAAVFLPELIFSLLLSEEFRLGKKLFHFLKEKLLDLRVIERNKISMPFFFRNTFRDMRRSQHDLSRMPGSVFDPFQQCFSVHF